MKKVFKSIMFIAAAAMAFSACNKEVDTQVPGKTGEMKNIQFSAPVNDAATRATLTTEDESSFTAAWEVNDQMAIEALSTDASYEESGTATWNGTYFDTNLPASETRGEWLYTGYHPAKQNIAFGSARVQSGSNYNSHYDVMTGTVTYQNALLGQNAEGGHMVIPMERLTSMIYFHLTSDLNETLSSATLTVTGGDIAAQSVEINNGALEAGSSESNAITITFEEGTAPSASDFRLWFNTLPVNATSLSISVTTTSGKTATLTNPNGANYEAGKLYKIVKNGLNWQNGLTKGEEWSYTFTSKVYDANGTQELKGKNWALAGNGNYWAYDGTKGQQFGSGNAPYKSMTLTSNFGDSYGVETILVNASGAKDIAATMSVTVGGKVFKYDNSNSASLTSTATEYTFASSDGTLASGDIVISFAQTSSKAIYVKKIEVNKDNRIDPELSFPQGPFKAVIGGTFTAPTLSWASGLTPAEGSITYAIDTEATDYNTNVASVNSSTGEVTIGTETGTAVIVATYAGNDDYKSGTASYTLTVSRAPNAEWEVVTDFSTIESGGTYIFVNVQNGTSYYMKSSTCSVGDGTECTSLSLLPTEAGFEVTDDMCVILTGNTTDGFIVSNLDGKQLYIKNTNNGLGFVDSGTTVKFYTDDDVEGYTLCGYDNADPPVLRYVGMNGTTNFRCYNGVNNNVKTGEFVWYHHLDNINWTLSSISINTPPTTTEYYAGDVFDPTGMIVKANYVDADNTANTKSMTLNFADLTFSPDLTTTLTTSNTSITISFEGKTATQPITVNPAPSWVLSGIAVTTPPTKVAYVVGETFDPTGLVVTATYEDDNNIGHTKTEDIDNADLTFTPSIATPLQETNDAVVISYNNKSVSQPITVTANTTHYYVKVTSTSNITDGDYLIVYESENVAFNGGLSTLDGANNTIPVSIGTNGIESTATTNAAKFTINVANGTIRSASGFNIGVSSYGNGLKQNANASAYGSHSFSIDNGNAIIYLTDPSWNSNQNGKMILNYNSNANDKRFRYYKEGSQKAIQLYKLN